MSLGDIGFVAAFIIFPLVIVGLSIWGLRTLNQRQQQPLARFSSNTPAESTQELPVAQIDPERNWAAMVQPTRGRAATDPLERTRTQTLVMPNYRGRARGVVRRVNTKPRRTKQRPN